MQKCVSIPNNKTFCCLMIVLSLHFCYNLKDPKYFNIAYSCQNNLQCLTDTEKFEISGMS